MIKLSFDVVTTILLIIFGFWANFVLISYVLAFFDFKEDDSGLLTNKVEEPDVVTTTDPNGETLRYQTLPLPTGCVSVSESYLKVEGLENWIQLLVPTQLANSKDEYNALRMVDTKTGTMFCVAKIKE